MCTNTIEFFIGRLTKKKEHIKRELFVREGERESRVLVSHLFKGEGSKVSVFVSSGMIERKSESKRESVCVHVRVYGCKRACVRVQACVCVTRLLDPHIHLGRLFTWKEGNLTQPGGKTRNKKLKRKRKLSLC